MTKMEGGSGNKDVTTGENLRHLQIVLLEMMKEIDALCRKHHITYYINGGNTIGAVRHKGFIPWDDDFDIMLLHEDYRRFIDVCRSELDPSRWIVHEGSVDWPGCHTKIRLRDTFLEDPGDWDGLPPDERGIFIDVFELVNAPRSPLARRIQFAAGKLLIAESLLKRGYKTDSIFKKFILGCARMLSVPAVKNLCRKVMYRYCGKDTDTVASFFERTRFHNAFHDADVFRKPVYAEYEDTTLPLPTDVDKYLTLTFGDYMTLPPEDKRRPAHALKIDFGPY